MTRIERIKADHSFDLSAHIRSIRAIRGLSPAGFDLV